jgi:hypothetical protein
LRLDAGLTEAVRGLIRTAASRGTAAVWDLLLGQEQRVSANPQLLALLRQGYIEHALADPAWLTGPNPPPVPTSSGHDDLYDVVAPAADRLRACRTDLADWPLAAVRFVELLTRCGVDSRTRLLLDELHADASGIRPPAGLLDTHTITRPGQWSAGARR